MLKKIFWSTFSSRSAIECYQKKIRDVEWKSYCHYIPHNSNFLDVGCGAGYNLMRAKEDLSCTVVGVDPAPGAHGVGRYTQGIREDRSIIQGFAENLPFNDASFDVVFSSHVLEHVASVEASLLEMRRVLKPGGVLIIGMPTTTMSVVALISHFCFTSHVNVLFFLKSLFSFQNDVLDRFIHIFIPRSHSFPNARFIFYDLRNYSIRNWRKIILKYWKIEKQLMPMLYPYPDYIQWFPMIKSKYLSSSVFFICRK